MGKFFGALAQLEEQHICNVTVSGSIPFFGVKHLSQVLSCG